MSPHPTCLQSVMKSAGYINITRVKSPGDRSSCSEVSVQFRVLCLLVQRTKRMSPLRSRYFLNVGRSPPVWPPPPPHINLFAQYLLLIICSALRWMINVVVYWAQFTCVHARVCLVPLGHSYRMHEHIPFLKTVRHLEVLNRLVASLRWAVHSWSEF